jgi:hypothetical protein
MMTTARSLVLAVGMAMATMVCAQSPVQYDYCWIEIWENSTVYLASPDSASRWVKVDRDLRKDHDPNLRMAMRLVQDYEAQGWELFNVEMGKDKFFLMRKPKR